MKKFIRFGWVAIPLVFFACNSLSPTSSSGNGRLALRLHFVSPSVMGQHGSRFAPATAFENFNPGWPGIFSKDNKPGLSNFPTKANAPAQQIDRVEIFVTAAEDTLAQATVLLQPGETSFSATLEVPAGEGRDVIVEAFSTLVDEIVIETLEFHGVTRDVTIAAGSEQAVEVTLFPAPQPGSSAVLIIGDGSGKPGSSGNRVPIFLSCFDPLVELEFDLELDTTVIFPDTAALNENVGITGLQTSLTEDKIGTVFNVFLFNDSGEPFPKFSLPTEIMGIQFRVNAGVDPQTQFLNVVQAFALAEPEVALEVISISGAFQVLADSTANSIVSSSRKK